MSHKLNITEHNVSKDKHPIHVRVFLVCEREREREGEGGRESGLPTKGAFYKSSN